MYEQSNDVLKNVRHKVNLLLDRCGRQSYDYNHVRRVAKNAVALAESRSLNAHTAEMIGLLHDVGRIDAGVYGGQHAAAGAEIAGRWLQGFGADDELIQTVTDAIGVHNKKKKIHGAYAELIKDSDSLAHQDEFAGMLREYENARCELAFLAPFEMRFHSAGGLRDLYDEKCKAIADALAAASSALPDDEMIHQTRINIRIIRSIHWLTAGCNNAETRAWDKSLKAYFVAFEQSRKLTVFIKTLTESGMLPKAVLAAEGLLQEENERVASFIAKNLDTLQFAGAKICLDTAEIDTGRRLRTYKETLMQADVKDTASLHKLRIAGKKFKYLVQAGILALSAPGDIVLLSDYHDTIGDLCDIEENRGLLGQFAQEGKLELAEADKLRLLASFDLAEGALKKHAKLLLFKLKKRCFQNGSGFASNSV